MKLAVLGATGTIGRRVVAEALARGHQVTALARDPSALAEAERLKLVECDVTSTDQLGKALLGHQAIVSAVGPNTRSGPSIVVAATRAVAAACMKADVRRVLVVNGAGSLSVKPGLELLHTPDFPAAWRDVALAHREALGMWRRVKELDWTVISPAALVDLGPRTGSYRTGHDELLVDEHGVSRISADDLAIAIIDELDHGGHFYERISFAY
jgi:putative NADH-flavin reductase